MPLGFVDLEDLSDLQIQSMIAVLQPFGQILVYRRFGDAEVLGGCADGGVVFNDIHGQIAGPFLHVVSQSQHSLHIVLWQCMR